MREGGFAVLVTDAVDSRIRCVKSPQGCGNRNGVVVLSRGDQGPLHVS